MESYLQWQYCSDRSTDAYEDCDDDMNLQLNKLSIGTDDTITIPVMMNNNAEWHITRDTRFHAIQRRFNKKTKEYDDSKSLPMRASSQINWVRAEDETKMSFDNIGVFETTQTGQSATLQVNDSKYSFVRQSDTSGFLILLDPPNPFTPSNFQVIRKITALDPDLQPVSVQVPPVPSSKPSQRSIYSLDGPAGANRRAPDSRNISVSSQPGQVVSTNIVLNSISSRPNPSNAPNASNTPNASNNVSAANFKLPPRVENPPNTMDVVLDLLDAAGAEDSQDKAESQDNESLYQGSEGDVKERTSPDIVTINPAQPVHPSAHKPTNPSYSGPPSHRNSKFTQQPQPPQPLPVLPQEVEDPLGRPEPREDPSVPPPHVHPEAPMVLDPQLIWQQFDLVRREWSELSRSWTQQIERTRVGRTCSQLWQDKHEVFKKDASHAEIQIVQIKARDVQLPGLVVNIPLRRICVDAAVGPERTGAQGVVHVQPVRRRVMFRHAPGSAPHPTALKYVPVFGNNNKQLEAKQTQYLNNTSSYLPPKAKHTEYCDFDADTVRKLACMKVGNVELVVENELRKLTFERKNQRQFSGVIRYNLNSSIVLGQLGHNINEMHDNHVTKGQFMQGVDNKIEFTIALIDEQSSVEEGYIDPKIHLNTVEADIARDAMWKQWKFRVYSFTDPEFAFVFFMSLFDFISDVVYINLGYYETDLLHFLAVLFVLLPLFAFLLSHGHLWPVCRNFVKYCVDTVGYFVGLKTDRTDWLKNRGDQDSKTLIGLVMLVWDNLNYKPTPQTLPNGRIVYYPRLTHVVVKLLSIILQVCVVLLIGAIALTFALAVLGFYALLYVFDWVVVLLIILVNIFKYLLGLTATVFILVYLKGGAWKYVSRFYLFAYCGIESVYFEWIFEERKFYYEHGCLRHETMECQCGAGAPAGGAIDESAATAAARNRVGSASDVMANDIVGARQGSTASSRVASAENVDETDAGNLVKMLNVAIVCEVFVESLPQLIILSINKWGESDGSQSGEDTLFWLSWLTSLFMIVNLGYAFGNYLICGGLSWNQALKTPIYPVNE